MDVILDGSRIDAAGTTLASALDAARKRAGERLIVRATADGVAIAPSDLDHPPATDPYASRLEFTSAERDLLLKEAGRDAAEALDALRERQSAASELLQQGKVHEAVGQVAEIVTQWSVVRQAILLTLRASPEDRYHDADRAELNSVLTGLASSLKEIKRAISHQDWSGLGDVLAWDLQEPTDRCRLWLLRASGGG
jgi:hypothetical protein